MKKKVNYINNKTLYTAMLEHRSKVKNAKENNLPEPQTSRYIGEAILKINHNLALKGCFSGYTYRAEMESDGIMDCVAAVNNFDPDKTNNPFAYFTMIAWRAFLRRIEKEKKQTYIKHKNFINSFITEDWGTEQNSGITNEYSDEVIKNFENRLTNNKKSTKIKGIEKFANNEVKNNEERTLSSADHS